VGIPEGDVISAGGTATTVPTVPSSNVTSVFLSSPFLTVIVTGRGMKPWARTTTFTFPTGNPVNRISPASFAEIAVPSLPTSDASAFGITAPLASFTTIRTRPDCAMSGATAVNKAPMMICRRLRATGADSPPTNPHTHPPASRQTLSHSSLEYRSTACSSL